MGGRGGWGLHELALQVGSWDPMDYIVVDAESERYVDPVKHLPAHLVSLTHIFAEGCNKLLNGASFGVQ